LEQELAQRCKSTIEQFRKASLDKGAAMVEIAKAIGESKECTLGVARANSITAYFRMLDTEERDNTSTLATDPGSVHRDEANDNGNPDDDDANDNGNPVHHDDANDHGNPVHRDFASEAERLRNLPFVLDYMASPNINYFFSHESQFPPLLRATQLIGCTRSDHRE
jgi:hypothetical protein